MRVAVVGAGPAGSTVARELARKGAEVVVFDPSHPREKPCGGGLAARALELLPAESRAQAVAAEEATFIAPSGRAVTFAISPPLHIASRRELDGSLLEAARRCGAKWERDTVISIGSEPPPVVEAESGRRESFDFVVGADGVRSVVARTFRGGLRPTDLTQSVGYFLPQRVPTRIVVRFLERGSGYLWAFPRWDHVALGACCDLGTIPAKCLWTALDAFRATFFPQTASSPGTPYSALIPTPSLRSLRRLPFEGPGWALVGDAAGLVDPVTREGIPYALETARALAHVLEDRPRPGAYTELLKRTVLPELELAARAKARFFEPRQTELTIEFAERSGGVRTVLVDLISGTGSYRGLRRRLVLQAFPLAVEYAFRRRNVDRLMMS